MIFHSLLLCLIIQSSSSQLSDGSNDDTAINLPPPKLNMIESCYSSRLLTKGLCAVDADCADDSERCYTQVCIAKHTIQKTAYKASTIDTIIGDWPPLNPNNKMPIMDTCTDKTLFGNEYTAGCYITRYIDWPPGTNTHLRTTDNAGFRGGCSNGYYEMDKTQRLPEGCVKHDDGTRTLTCFCSNENDCNMAWKGTYLQQDYVLPSPSASMGPSPSSQNSTGVALVPSHSICSATGMSFLSVVLSFIF